MQLSYHAAAEAELLDAALYYDSSQVGVGRSFLDAFDASVTSILLDPSRLPFVFDDVRRQPVRGFPYDVYFRNSYNEVRVVAVVHHHRTPDYWKGRR